MYQVHCKIFPNQIPIFQVNKAIMLVGRVSSTFHTYKSCAYFYEPKPALKILFLKRVQVMNFKYRFLFKIPVFHINKTIHLVSQVSPTFHIYKFCA